MKLRQLPNGNLIIPVGIYLDGIDGNAYEEIAPSDPRYADWAKFIGTLWDADFSEEPSAVDAELTRLQG